MKTLNKSENKSYQYNHILQCFWNFFFLILEIQYKLMYKVYFSKYGPQQFKFILKENAFHSKLGIYLKRIDIEIAGFQDNITEFF